MLKGPSRPAEITGTIQIVHPTSGIVLKSEKSRLAGRERAGRRPFKFRTDCLTKSKRATVYTKSDPMRERAVRPATAAGPVVVVVAAVVAVKKDKPERAAHSDPLVSAPALVASCFTSS